MEKVTPSRGDLFPVAVATVASLALYYRQALLLLRKVGEVFGGVLDTGGPAVPLAGLLFVLMFMALRWGEFQRLLADRRRDTPLSALGVAMAVIPLPPLLLFGSALLGSYVYAAVALATAWVGVAVALRPSVFRFLWPYLLAYVAAIGSVSVLTTVAGDPLAVVVASLSSAMTWLFQLPVQWSSVYIHFVAAGNSPVSLYISQECSGIASISIFLLLMGLMHLDVRPSSRVSLAFALGGAVLFVVLNSLRVVAVIWGGSAGGTDFMWSLHGWVGYAFYIAGYSLLVLLYMRAKRQVRSGPPGRPPSRDSPIRV